MSEETSAIAQQGVAEPRLLLIEDDSEDSRLLLAMLQEARPAYHVIVKSSLEEALQAGDRTPWTIILVDLGLPDRGGMETFERCRSEWPESPIVVLANLADEGLAQEAVRSGAQDYLVKGDINARALCRALRYATDRHHAAEERRFLVQELEQSRKLEAIGQLAAGVAHEINTPTQYVSDNTRFLQETVADLVQSLERVRECCRRGQTIASEEISTILEDADVDYLLSELPRAVAQSLTGLEHIARIVRAMKEFSHPGGGDEKTPTDINKALDTTILVASNEWKYVAEIERCYDPELPAVHC